MTKSAMVCEQVERRLAVFHFGEVDEAMRVSLEEHLVGCSRCVGAMLAVKRSVELGEDEATLSSSARARLRAEVAQSLGVMPWRWWERPLFIGLATAVVALAAVTASYAHTLERAPAHSLSQR